jgi:hypothetical protein
MTTLKVGRDITDKDGVTHPAAVDADAVILFVGNALTSLHADYAFRQETEKQNIYGEATVIVTVESVRITEALYLAHMTAKAFDQDSVYVKLPHGDAFYVHADGRVRKVTAANADDYVVKEAA